MSRLQLSEVFWIEQVSFSFTVNTGQCSLLSLKFSRRGFTLLAPRFPVQHHGQQSSMKFKMQCEVHIFPIKSSQSRSEYQKCNINKHTFPMNTSGCDQICFCWKFLKDTCNITVQNFAKQHHQFPLSKHTKLIKQFIWVNDIIMMLIRIQNPIIIHLL